MSAAAQPEAAPKRRRWVWWAGAVLLAIAALVIWLVFFWGVMRKSWSEEVQVGAGEVIVVKRHMKLVKVYTEWPQTGFQTRFEAMRLPDGVRFETEDRIAFVRLERGPSPGTWVLIGSPLYCEEFNKYGRPKPDYIQFEYDNGRWTYRAVQPEFLGRPANLLISDRYARDGSRVTLADKERWNSTSEGIAYVYLVIDPTFSSVCP